MIVKYDQEFMKSKLGKSLYAKWRNIGRAGRCKEWDDFNTFCKWAMDNDCDALALLKRYDAREEYCPDNCYILKRKPKSEYYVDQELCKKWNKTVNRIRVHYGMEPLGGEE